MKKEKQEEKKEKQQVKKRNTKLDNLEMTKRIETRTRKRLAKAYVPAQTLPQIVQVEQKEDPKPAELPPRKKLPAKKYKAWLATKSAHYLHFCEGQGSIHQ